MIASLTGIVSEIQGRTVILDVGGVGYEVRCSEGCLSTLVLGEKAKLVVYTEVREDAIVLYGFADKMEKQAFLLLLQVKGVGAKSASDIISRVDKLDLLRAIGAGNTALLQGVKGVGKKTAERIIVELKDKVSEFAMEQAPSAAKNVANANNVVYEEALQALLALGFPKKNAEGALRAALEGTLPGSLDSGQIVKEALRYI